MINWGLQIYYLLDIENMYINYEKYIYSIILIMIVHDDIYLMKYLVNYNKNNNKNNNLNKIKII